VDRGLPFSQQIGLLKKMRSTKSHQMTRNSALIPLLCFVLPRGSRLFLCCVLALSFLFVPFRGNTKTDNPTSQLSLSQPLTVKWRYVSDQTTSLTPATDGARIYLPLAGGTVVALNVADGQLRWKSDSGGDLSASPAADDRSVYVATEFDAVVEGRPHERGALRALGKEAGVTLWMRTLQAPLRGALVVGEKALFGGAIDGRVYAFDKRTGLTLWSSQYSAAFSSQPLLSGARLYIGSEDGALLAIDQANGRIVWRYRTRGPIRGPVAIANGIVYFGSGDGYAYAVREAGFDLLWRRRTGAGVQAVATVDNGLMVASLDNFVYLFSLNTGRHLWRRQLPGRIAAPPVTASDGALFTPLSSDSAIVLSLRDGKPVNTLSIGEENSSAASPISAGQLVFVTAPHGLLAFAGSNARP
jgi:outer membrane protein assembly factor BamB